MLLWNVASGQEMFKLEQTGMTHLTALAFSPDGKTLAVDGQFPSGRGEVFLWLGEEGGPP